METHRLEKEIRHDLSIEEAFLCKLLVEESVWLVIPGVVVFRTVLSSARTFLISEEVIVRRRNYPTTTQQLPNDLLEGLHKINR